jgi:hypothetical protein
MPLQSNRFSVFGSLGRLVSGILRSKIVTPTAQTKATAIPAIHIVIGCSMDAETAQGQTETVPLKAETTEFTRKVLGFLLESLVVSAPL